MENGEIPEGVIIHHVDEDPRNNDSKNLAPLPRNEHTPNMHYHWKTRDWETADEMPPLPKKKSDEIEFWSNLDRRKRKCAG